MADMFTIKVMGTTTKYQKKGGKYYRVKTNGELSKAPASGMVLANLKNKDSGMVKSSSPETMLAKVRSAVDNKSNTKKETSSNVKKANASTIKASVKDDGGKAALQASKEYKSRPAAKLTEKRALDIIKNDTNNIPKDEPKSRPKSITDMRTKDVKMVTLKSGEKGTIKQRLAEIQQEKITELAKNSLAAKAKKANKGGMMKKTKMMGGGYSMKKKK
jgi:hypothetical protein